MSLADELDAELPGAARSAENGAKRPASPPATSHADGPYEHARAIPTPQICDKLALEHDGRFATCPGCGETGAAIALDKTGLKCLHERCARRGRQGYRTNVDLVAEVRGVSTAEAVNLIAEWFGFDPLRSKPIQPRGDEPPVADAPEAMVLTTLGSLIEPALARAERRRSGEETPIPLPFREYADILGGGLWPGAHFIVSGTGVGKSQKEIQVSIHAAKAGVPVAYVGLELDETQIALRALGAETGTGWSKLYLGKCSSETIAKARAAVPVVSGLPFYVDFGPPRGWPASRLYALAEGMRRAHPAGPIMIVLDYLQLIGDEPVAFDRRPDLRERIGGAAYAARDVARRYDAAVVLISSAARAHYGLLASDVGAAGLGVRHDSYGTTKVIQSPDVLIGLGKESGELEFAGDSVTVLVKWPTMLANGERAVIVAVPKMRTGPPRWCVLAFDGQRFVDLPVDSADDLPAVVRPHGGKGPVSDDDLVERAVATLTRLGTAANPTKIQQDTIGRKGDVLNAIKRAIVAGRIVQTDQGELSVPGSRKITPREPL